MSAHRFTPTHQTTRLAKGKHLSPDSGVCVMELASMLAGERFSDRPASVSPVIGSFARGYNDACDDDRRQTLYDWASRAVGSRAAADIERERERALVDVARAIGQQLPPWRRRMTVVWRALPKPPLVDLQRERLAGLIARELARRSDGHAVAEALFERLLAVGRAEWRARDETTSGGSAHDGPVVGAQRAHRGLVEV
jgi:hypothetical protein